MGIEKPAEGLGLTLLRGGQDDFSRSLPAVVVSVAKGCPLEGRIEAFDRITDVNGTGGSVDAIAGAISAGKSLDITFRKLNSFHANIIKAGRPVGIDIVHGCQDEFVLIVQVNEGGAIAETNARYEDRSIRPYDCIMEVNGMRGSDAIFAELAKSDTLHMSFLRLF